MKNILQLFLMVFFLPLQANDHQVIIRGTITRNYRTFTKGDVIPFHGRAVNNRKQVFFLTLYQNRTEAIPAKYVELHDEDISFWEKQRFIYTGDDIQKKGWQVKKRKELEDKTLNYIADLEIENRIYKDKFAEDYLQRLIQRIHYPKFYKGRDQYLRIKILNSDKPVLYAFDNGSMLISTQLLAITPSERELVRLLATAVGHILLDSNLKNIDNYSDQTLKQLGAIYKSSAKKAVKNIAGQFMEEFEEGKDTTELYLGNKIFYNNISGIISYSAWQEYYNQHYHNALTLINKLIDHNIATDEDYLLKAKIFRQMANTREANFEALSALEKSVSIGTVGLRDVYAEQGIILMRLERYKEAQDAFVKYKNSLEKAGDAPKELKWANQMIHKCKILTPEIATKTEKPVNDTSDVEKEE